MRRRAGQALPDLRTWWHYHWWIVLFVAVVIGVAVHLVLMNLWKTEPDCQFAYVGTKVLPEDTIRALETALSEFGEDWNGDGVVTVTVHAYVLSEDDVQESIAAETLLMADLVDGESTFFLLEDPDGFQQSNQALALLDGSCPQETDRSGLDKVYRWRNCPVLAGLPLGQYTETILGQSVSGESQALLEDLYLGRRCFYSEETDPEADPAPRNEAALWEKLTEGAIQ